MPFIDELGTLDRKVLDDFSVKVIAIKKYLDKERRKNSNPVLDEQLKTQINEITNYILYFFDYHKERQKTGKGLMYYHNPNDLLKRLELLDGSLRAGNNGVIHEYILILHKLKNMGVISNTKLNKTLRGLYSNKIK